MNFLSKIKTETKVGLLILSSVGLIIYSSIAVTGWKASESSSYRLIAYFEDAGGLNESTAVRIAGIKVGTVEKIELEKGKAKVTLRIFDQYSIYEDSVAAVRSLGILGDKYLEINQGSQGGNRLVEGDEIRLIASGKNLDALILSLSDILNNLKSVTQAMKDSLGGPEGTARLNRILDNTEFLTADLRDAIGKTNQRIDTILINFENFSQSIAQITTENRKGIKGLIDGFEATGKQLEQMVRQNRESIRNIIANLEQFTGTLKRDTPEITENLKGILEENRQALNNTLIQLDSATERLDKAMQSLDSGAENLDSITDKIDSGEGTIGRLVNDEKTIDELNEAIEGLNSFLGQANKSRLDLGVRLEYLPQIEKKNVKGSVRLEYKPSPDSFYIVGFSNSPGGKKKETRTVRTTTSGGTSTTTEETEEKTTDDFLLSLQIAKTFYDTRFRAGFFDSSIGFGLEQYFGTRRQYSVFTELYDFSRENEGANLKIGANWYLWQHFYLTAGGFDVINEIEDNRSYFIGFGLDFNEDNLKLLTTSIPFGSL